MHAYIMYMQVHTRQIPVATVASGAVGILNRKLPSITNYPKLKKQKHFHTKILKYTWLGFLL